MLPRLRRLLVRGLSHPRLPLALALLAVALALPSLTVGWQLDDHWQRAVLFGRTETSPWYMFWVPTSQPSFLDSGTGPWWIAGEFHFNLFRFLTVATHRLDHALWPDSAVLMHDQSLLWFGLLVAAATVLYRRMLGAGWVAGLAALAFAVDDAHVLPAAWIATRSTLLTTRGASPGCARRSTCSPEQLSAAYGVGGRIRKADAIAAPKKPAEVHRTCTT